MQPVRKIIHVDMDAFYTSVEQRDDPSLLGRPVVVGGDPDSRGVVAAASYEARKFGIRSAMSCAKAYRLCPHAVFIYPNFKKYSEASRQIREIFQSVTPLVEPLALDEAYLDVTENRKGEPLAKNLAHWIKTQIKTQLNLSASAGVGPNKFIAKLASDFRKPDGLVVVPPEKVYSFIENLPVEKFWGVGPATAKKLYAAGFRTAADIRSSSPSELQKTVGSYGHFLFELAHGRDEREVDPSFDPKSCGTETTFEKDIYSADELLKYVSTQAHEVSLELKKLERPGRTVTLKIKYSDFTSITRSQTLFHPIDDEETISKTAAELLFKNTEIYTRPVRLIGVSVGNLIRDEDPLQLWFNFRMK